ncbi:TPA: hypothetical protein KEW63_002429 [Proteus mirabilis]|nr:hypothetical protein [Proteus mirabilis]HEK1865293.1 hypothetical protein [Proteus mirabilis]
MILNIYQLILITGISTVCYFYGLILQPIYLLGPIYIGLSILYSIKNIVTYEKRIIISIFFISLLTIGIIFTQILVKANNGVLWNFSLCLIIYISTILISPLVDKKKCSKIIIKIIWFLVIYALFDGIWRFLHPNPDQIFTGNPYFYRFKDNSLMFEDSNFVGATLVVAYGALRYLHFQFKQKCMILYILLYLATFITFSRASIISLVALEFFCLFWRLNKFNKIIVIVIVIAIVILYLSLNILFEDGSFRSKFYIIDLFIKNFPTLPLQNKLLGIGLGNSFEKIGIGAHTVIIVYCFELGIIGTLFQLLIILLMVFASRGTVLFLLVPYYINSFSLTAIAIPILFLFSGLVTVISSKVKNG